MAKKQQKGAGKGSEVCNAEFAGGLGLIFGIGIGIARLLDIPIAQLLGIP